MSQHDSEYRWLVDPKVNGPAYWLVHAAGAAQILGGGALVIYGASVGEWVLAALLVVGGLFFVAVAGILGARKGGVAYFEATGAVRIYGRSVRDALEIPKERIAGLRVIRRREVWGGNTEPLFVCSVELACTSGMTVLLLELSNLEDAQEVALLFREVTGWTILTEAVGRVDTPAPIQAAGVSASTSGGELTLSMSPGSRYALSLVTVTLGGLSLATGALLLAGVDQTGVAGFLFGPFLGALGLCCLLLWSFHVWGEQRLLVRRGKVDFGWSLWGWVLGRKTVEWGASSRVRIRTRGALGFAMELVSEDRIIAAASGCTVGSAVPPESLVSASHHLLAARPTQQD